MYFFYLQLLIIPFADDRAKKVWNLPLCASEKEKYISGAADFGRQLTGKDGKLIQMIKVICCLGLGHLLFTKKAVNQRLPQGKLLAGL